MKTAIPALLGLLLFAAPAAVQAQSGSGDGYDYSVNADGATITNYTGAGGAVTIPTKINGLTVVSIGDGAHPVFSASLTNVTVSSGITNINVFAFESCTNLSSVTIADGLLSIGEFAFYGCSSLTNFTIPASVTNIGAGLFTKCRSLTAITVDAQNAYYSSVNGVLADKNQTTVIEYPAGLSGSYSISQGIASVGNYAFYECPGVTGITIPSSVTNIGEFAFSGCGGLSHLTLPGGISSIGQYAFSQCGLTNIAIPGSVTNIGANTFYQCSSLASVVIPGSLPNIPAEMFYECYKLTNVIMANGITSIGAAAFYFCESLAAITIPGSVTNIEANAFYGPGVSKVYFQGNAPAATPIAFANNNATVYYLPGAAGWSSSFAGRPTALWSLPNPLIWSDGPAFGVESNGFGFTISWATNIVVVVEACTNLANPVWTPIQTNTLANGLFGFSDPLWTNYPERYYRIAAP